MSLIRSLLTRLEADFPDIHFVSSDNFHWSHASRTITYLPHEAQAAQQLLHEVAHATLDHQSYDHDITLLEMERDAWQYAIDTLMATYDIPIEDTLVQSSLDTYRDWLHARSTCPHCSATGIQVRRHQYHCIACGQKWRVNEARICGLRRFVIK